MKRRICYQFECKNQIYTMASDMGKIYFTKEKRIKDKTNQILTDYIINGYGNDQSIIDLYTDEKYPHREELIYSIESQIDFCDFERWVSFEDSFNVSLNWNSFKRIMDALYEKADIDIYDIIT